MTLDASIVDLVPTGQRGDWSRSQSWGVVPCRVSRMCQGEGPAERKRTPIRVLIIIPALNESATLPGVLQGLRKVLPDFDVVVIDDGSTDDTAGVARANGAIVLQLPFNLGIGGALRTGFRYAVAHDYDAGVQLDADGQHDPEMITRLLDALADSDFVIGSRFASATSYEVGRTRRSAMKMLQLAMRLLSGRSFTDTSSGFRAFGRPVLQYFAQSYPSEYMESVEALLAANYAGFRIAEVPVQMHQRAGGTPSAVRIKLLYHYVRVVFTMLTRVQRRPVGPPVVVVPPLKAGPGTGPGDGPLAVAGTGPLAVAVESEAVEAAGDSEVQGRRGDAQ